MDAITLLKEDHKKVRRLFAEFDRLGDGGAEEKRRIVDRLIDELSLQTAIEEQVFYPEVRERVAGTEKDILDCLEEHHVIKWTLSELSELEPTADRFDAKVRVLMQEVVSHTDWEDEELFPLVREALGRKALADLGETLEKAKQVAPRRPQPRAPDTPRENIVTAAASSILDSEREIEIKTPLE